MFFSERCVCVCLSLSVCYYTQSDVEHFSAYEAPESFSFTDEVAPDLCIFITFSDGSDNMYL